MQAPEQRVDIGIIRNVIAEVRHRRSKDRRQPDSIDSELDQIRQTSRDAAQVTNAVVIAVLKRPRINLIDDGGLPPKPTLHDGRQFGSSMLIAFIGAGRGGAFPPATSVS